MPTFRYRKRDTEVQASYTVTNRDGNGNLQDAGTVVSDNKKSGEFKGISDVTGTNWRAAKKQGTVLLNPVTIVSRHRTCTDSNWFFGPHTSWGSRSMVGAIAAIAHRNSSFSGRANAFAAMVDDAKNQALIEAYAKMKQPDVLASVAFAEREKTVATVHNRALKLADEKLNRVIDRRDSLVRKGMKHGKASAQSWMEFRFGFRPIIADMVGMMKAASRSRPKKGAVLISRGGVGDLKLKDQNIAVESFPSLTSITRSTTWQFSARVNAGVIYVLRDLSSAEWFARCTGLGATTIPQHVWETVPLSWVADYFYDCGGWLAAATPDPDLIVKGNWVSTVYQEDNSTSLSDARCYVTLSPVTDYHQGGGSYFETLNTFTREVDRPFPMTPPRIVKPLSFSKTLDLAALTLGNINTKFGSLRI